MSWLDAYFVGYTTIQVGGAPLPQETTLNFATGATAVDDPANGRTTVNIEVFIAPTGTGFPHITSGGVDPAARAVNIASSDVTGLLPLTNLAYGTAGQFLVTHSGSSGPAEYQSITGDVSASTSTPGQLTVVALQNNEVSSTAPSDGFSLVWSAGSSMWVPTFIGSPSTVTGTGFWFASSGVLNGAAITLTGDISQGALSSGQVPLTVTGIQGIPVSNATPTDAQVLFYSTGSSEYVPVTLGGDISVTDAGVVTVNDINGASVPAAGALTVGFVLQVTGSSALDYALLPVASIAPGSPGYLLTSYGSSPGVAQWTTPTNAVLTALHGDVVTAPGGLGNQAATVEALWGQSLPGSGAQTTGNVLQVLNGATALSYAAVNLAGGAGYITGNLPVTNIAPGTNGYVLTTTAGDTVWAAPASSGITALTGDVTASGSGSVAATVVAVHGATVPAAGALTTGNVPQVNGTASLTYGPVNLAGGSNYVTGNLPIANVAPGLAAQVLMSNATPAATWTSLSQDLTISVSGAVTVTQAQGGFLTFGSGTGTISNSATSTAPGIVQGAAAASTSPVNMTFTPQAPNGGSGTAAQNTPGSLIVALSAPGSVGTAGAEAAFQVTRGGTTYARIQALVGAPAQAAVYLGSAAPSGSNYVLTNPTNATILNSIGTTSLAVSGTATFSTSSGGASFGVGIGTLQWSQFPVPAINQLIRSSDSATNAFTISAQSAFATATTNVNGGALNLNGGASAGGAITAVGGNVVITPGTSAATTSGTSGSAVVALTAPVGTGSEAVFQVTRGGSQVGAIGYNGSENCLWLGTRATTAANAVMYSDNTYTYLNSPSGLFIYCNTVQGMSVDTSGNVNIAQSLSVAAGKNASFGAYPGSYGGGAGVIYVNDAVTQPTTPLPTSGIILSSNGGALQIFSNSTAGNGTAVISGTQLTFDAAAGEAQISFPMSTTLSTGGVMQLTAQSTSFAGSTGGALQLRAGSGVSAGGPVTLTTGGTTSTNTNGSLLLSSGAGTTYGSFGVYSSGQHPGAWAWAGPACTTTQLVTSGKTTLSSSGVYFFLPINLNGVTAQIVCCS